MNLLLAPKPLQIQEAKNTRSTIATKDNHGNKKRVLTVDDEPDTSLVLKLVLEDNGFEVSSSNDPTTVLKSFKANSYDLLVLDIKMPEMNGIKLYQEIRKKDNEVKICFLTASNMYHEKLGNEEYCLNKNWFIQKPIENENLVNKVAKILSL
jgi:DNA-binding response OmpR family regulator